MEKETCIRTNVDSDQIMCNQKLLGELEYSFSVLSEAMQLAGNPVRLKILFLFSKEKRLCVCDLSEILGMTNSAVSQHLRKLKDGNIIIPQREAQTIYYSILPKYISLFQPYFALLNANKILDENDDK